MTAHNGEMRRPGWKVPAYEEHVFSEKRTKYALVIPVVNEGVRLRRLLASVAASPAAGGVDVVVADGGSTDGSTDKAALRGSGLRALLVKTGPGRLSAQLRMAYAWSLEKGYAGVITIDGNGKDDPASLPLFLAALESGVDYAQASRFIPGGRAENTPLARWAAIRLIHAPLISLAAGVRLTDTTQGYRGYSAGYLTHPQVQPFRDVFQNYELLAYLSVRAGQLGLKVLELPTARRYPRGEPVPTKIAGWRGHVELLMTLFRTIRG
jgi:glycosyltransferase involved in cell wall biosynthesis